MRLTLGNFNMNGVEFADETRIEKGILYVNKAELSTMLKEDKHIEEVELYLARPGESVRIVPVKDVVEPRVKVEGKGNMFPGFLGAVDTVGRGKTYVLKNIAVVTTGKIVGFQEGIIDMVGPGAQYTPFSKTFNVVVKVTPIAGLSRYEHEYSVRMAGLKAATYLADVAKSEVPDDEEVFEIGNFVEASTKYAGLTKVAYIYMLQTQGLLHDTYVYGVDTKKILPTLISPTEIFDGALVSGNCVSACDKNTTYVHLNNPIIKELFKRHGKDLNFMGVIITNESVTLQEKERSSDYTAKLAAMLGIEAAIVSEEGFGNPDADLVMNCRKLEQLGVKTVLVTDEYAGRDGCSQSLADVTPEANAVITAGNANEVIILPKLGRTIGHLEVVDTIAGGFVGSIRPDGTIEVELQAITGATSEVGFNKLTAIGF